MVNKLEHVHTFPPQVNFERQSYKVYVQLTDYVGILFIVIAFNSQILKRILKLPFRSLLINLKIICYVINIW
mgnify:FL=1